MVHTAANPRENTGYHEGRQRKRLLLISGLLHAKQAGTGSACISQFALKRLRREKGGSMGSLSRGSPSERAQENPSSPNKLNHVSEDDAETECCHGRK